MFNKRISWIEWASASAGGFILAVIFHLIAINGMTSDVQTLSGQITSARQYSEWKEYYEYAVYRTEYYNTTETYYTTDSKGRSHSHTRTVRKSRRVFDHWEPTSRWHRESWGCVSDIDTSYDIDKSKYIYFTEKYKMNRAVAGKRTTGEHNSRMIAGDPNDYIADTSITHWVEPVTKEVSWENKVKACPSVFSFIKVPTNVPVFNWPNNPDPFRSDRVLGTAQRYMPILEWDKLNAYLGGRKKVNLILVGFESSDSMLGQYQRAKWVGGKKNDLVITVGGKDLHRPDWCFVYGWTDSELVKANITSYVMQNGISTNLCGYLNNEVIKNYKIKEWKDFDYLHVEPAAKYYFWYIGFLLVIQVGLYVWFNYNDFDKQGKY